MACFSILYDMEYHDTSILYNRKTCLVGAQNIRVSPLAILSLLLCIFSHYFSASSTGWIPKLIIMDMRAYLCLHSCKGTNSLR